MANSSQKSALKPAGLTKNERLSGKKAVDTLMKKGCWGNHGLLKFCFMANEEDTDRMMVSVPKKFFKRAVKRNLLKRRIRESYRTGKMGAQGRCHFDLMIVYNSSEVADSPQIRNDVQTVVGKVTEKLCEK